jgi:hypothetical protein
MLPYNFNDIEYKPVDWIWQGRLARGALTVLQADPGVGKGLVAHYIAARLTKAEPLPGESYDAFVSQRLPPQNVLFCVGEDRKETLKARAHAASADMTRLDGAPTSEMQAQMGDAVAMQYVLERLESWLSQKEYGLLVIDPLFGFLESLGSACNRDARRALTALMRIAERRNCAVLAIHHLTKAAGRSALYRGQGAAAIAAVARIVLAIGMHPTVPEKYVLATVKNNISPPAPSIVYVIDAHQSQFEGKPISAASVSWLGFVELTADDLLIPPKPAPPLSEKARAHMLLEELLANGPVDQAKIGDAAFKKGISKTALRNAKADLGLRSIKRNYGQGAGTWWEWALPFEQPVSTIQPKPENS